MLQKLSSYDACAVIEGFDGEEHTQEEIIAAFQSLIDNGMAWQLQGFYGRTAAALIEQGLCHHRRTYYEMQNVGKAKYLVNFHDGVKKHDDGSKFYDVKIFKNKKLKDNFIKELKINGYYLR